jgi:putative ABC transport system permease protein
LGLTVLFVGGWLFGIGSVLPGLIEGVGRVARAGGYRLGTVGRLAVENFLRDRGRVTLTTSTLLIAVALVVGMTGFMAFMMDTLMFRTIDELTSHPGWTVMTVDVSKGTSIYTEATLLPPEKKDAFYAAFEDRANIAEFNFVIVPELSFLGDTYFSFVLDPYGVRATGDAFFSFSEGSWDTALPIMEAGCGVLLPPFTASKIGVDLGETFPVTGKNGPVTCTVAGIGSSFVLASIIGDAVKDQFAGGEPFSLYLSPQFGVDAGQLEQDIFALAKDVSLNVTTIAGFAEPMEEAFGQIKVMFNGMLLLAMITAALAVVNTTAMSVAERRRELGLLRAVGAQRAQITALITLEAGLIGLIGGVMGLVTGVGFAMIVVLVYGGNSWGFTEMLPWPTAWQVAQPALMTGALGMVAAPFVAALAAWFPARALTRGTVIETLTPKTQTKRRHKSKEFNQKS